jgi:hypothetical protein
MFDGLVQATLNGHEYVAAAAQAGGIRFSEGWRRSPSALLEEFGYRVKRRRYGTVLCSSSTRISNFHHTSSGVTIDGMWFARSHSAWRYRATAVGSPSVWVLNQPMGCLLLRLSPSHIPTARCTVKPSTVGGTAATATIRGHHGVLAVNVR